MEIISRVIARCYDVERLLGQKIQVQGALEEILIRLYSSTLKHLASVIRFFNKNTLGTFLFTTTQTKLSGICIDSPIVRVLKSSLEAPDPSSMEKVLEQEAELLKFVQLEDAGILRSLEASIIRLTTQMANLSPSLPEEVFTKALQWLSPFQYRHHHDFLSETRAPNTGQWLLSHPQYLDWKFSSSSSVFLLNGITGSGKTTLSSVIVDCFIATTKSHPSAAPFAYFYCSIPIYEREKASSDGIMRTLLAQLAIDKTGPNKLRDFFWADYQRREAEAKAAGLEPRKLTTKQCADLILELAEDESLTILVDGIDSLDELNRQVLINAFNCIVANASNVVKVFVTAINNEKIVKMLHPNKQKVACLCITAHDTRPDMEIFVRQQINNVVASGRFLGGAVSDDNCAELFEVLLNGAGEMYVLFCISNSSTDFKLQVPLGYASNRACLSRERLS